MNTLLDFLAKGEIGLLGFGLFLALVFNLQKVCRFLDERRKSRISNLKEALECSSVQGDTAELLEAEIETEYFRLCTGIKREKEFRNALLAAHKSTQLSLDKFRKALSYLAVVNRQITVILKWHDYLLGGFNFILGFFVLFYIPVIVLLLAQTETPTLLQFGISIIFGLVLTWCSFVILSQVWILKIARDIRAKLIAK